MQEVIERIMNSVEKKKVQSCCKMILKKCSFKSKNDLANVTNLATWLYIYGYYEEAIAVCDLLSEIVFTGNYDIWCQVEYALCLKARILREQGILTGREQLLEKTNEHRDPTLYKNGVEWYRTTLNENIRGEVEDSPRTLGYGWRIIKIKNAIRYREAGGHPIPDEEFDNDIKEIVDILKQLK